MHKTLKIIIFNILMIFIILAFFEGAMYILVHQPALLKHCPRGIKNSIGYLYSVGERKIIQFTPDCACYDSNLGYTLKPGSCVFAGAEFSNHYSINSRGLRDDEKSLHDPEIIIAGDSYAMGWGVDQEKTFADVLEKKSGLNVLNAAVASYGTAREMIMLRRLDTKHLCFLVIQYCENDFAENQEFFLKGNHLYTMSQEEYDRNTNLNIKPNNYYPGKYLFLKLVKKWNEFQIPKPKKQLQESSSPKDDKDDVDLFINAIMNSHTDFTNVQIIVLEAVGKDDFHRPFINRLRERIRNPGYPRYIRDIIPLDIAKVITKDQYYILDDHWTQDGHRAIADALLKIIQSAPAAANRLN